MRCLTVFLFVTVIQAMWSNGEEKTGLRNRWQKLNEFEDIYDQYYQSAESVIKTARNTIADIRSKSAKFVNEFFNHSMEVVNYKNITRNRCSEIVYNFMGMRRAFFTHLTKSETPLLSHITELEQKLNEINTTIKVYHGVAESKYLSCKMSNESCITMVNLWLEQETTLIACRLRRCQNETRNEDQKRPKRASKPCKPDEFTCSDRHCIKRSWICDGQFDCRDGSDEPAGCAQTCKDGFHCFRSLRCIDRSLICNNFNDCGDKTDELFCGTILKRNNDSYCSIENGLFKCPQDKCISIQHVCDGKNDCRNGTDEGEMCGKGICPQECALSGGACFHGPQGPICFPECPFGTFEAPVGCTLRPYLYESTAYDLLEGIPTLITRHNARFAYLKMKAMYSFSLQLANVIKCQLGMSTINQ